MPQTLVEKIIENHIISGKPVLGGFVKIKIDRLLCHEVTTPPAIEMLEKRGIEQVFDPEKIVVTPDHFIPAKDEKSAALAKQLDEWVRKVGIKHYYPIGRHGVCHTIFLEQGHIGPGMVAIAGDSHTCTHGVVGAFSFGVGTTDVAYAIATGEVWLEVPQTIQVIVQGKLAKGVLAKDAMLEVIHKLGVGGATNQVIEFSGEVIDALEVEDRVVFSNMAVEAGATCGIINPDEKTIKYVKERGLKDFEELKSDKDAKYEKTVEIDVSALEPQVAYPHLPSNTKSISEAKKDKIKIDQAYLGSCTNGRIADLREAAEVLKGQKIADGVRMIVVPATTDIWNQAEQEGLFKIFTAAGATISTPTCGACLGGHMGVLAAGERAIASTNRNFVGRMGSKESEVYLASPRIVATSAIAGLISD
ncbi:MAG: 3-isopropylmalate dehydratase large subunit [Patescibacteria group bacterium]